MQIYIFFGKMIVFLRKIWKLFPTDCGKVFPNGNCSLQFAGEFFQMEIAPRNLQEGFSKWKLFPAICRKVFPSGNRSLQLAGGFFQPESVFCTFQGGIATFCLHRSIAFCPIIKRLLQNERLFPSFGTAFRY